MPRVKTVFVHEHQDNPESWRKGLKFEVYVTVGGLFYCDLPGGMYLPLKNTFEGSRIADDKKKGTVRVWAETLDSLTAGIKKAYSEYTEPTVTKEPIIRYNIESHVSFAIDETGNVVPNAGYPRAHWPDKETKGMYGDHYAQYPSPGGYSLIIGARAETKTTTSYGSQQKITYEDYYAGGDHHGNKNPAERLNSWCSFSLGNKPKEIPYSDEAAEFFFNLMYGMAKLAQMVQGKTFEQEKLLALIHSGKLLMSGLERESNDADDDFSRERV